MVKSAKVKDSLRLSVTWVAAPEIEIENNPPFQLQQQSIYVANLF